MTRPAMLPKSRVFGNFPSRGRSTSKLPRFPFSGTAPLVRKVDDSSMWLFTSISAIRMFEKILCDKTLAATDAK
jgi:hypothetical protein